MTRRFLITGSVAMIHWCPDFPRPPGDVDLITKAKVHCVSPAICLVETAHNEAFQWILDHNIDDTFVDLDLLYTIKASHLGWDIKWKKTHSDARFLKEHGAKLNDELYFMLCDVWEKTHELKILPKQSEYKKRILQCRNPADRLKLIKE